MPFFTNIILPLLIGVFAESLLLKLFSRLLRASSITWPHVLVFAFVATLLAIAMRHMPLPLPSSWGIQAVVAGSVAFHAILGAAIFSRIKSPDGSTVGVLRGAGIASLSFLSVAGLLLLFVKVTASYA